MRLLMAAHVDAGLVLISGQTLQEAVVGIEHVGCRHKRHAGDARGSTANPQVATMREVACIDIRVLVRPDVGNELP